MTIKSLIILILMSTIGLACNPKPEDPTNPPVFKAEFVDHIKLSDYFTKMEYVFLEESDDGLFMNADVIEFFEAHWYILDEELRTIVCFSEEGDFKFRIHAVGKGPGEYQLPTSMFIHKKKREIWVQCKMSRKILRYDLEGKFIDYVPMGRAGIDMILFNDKDVITFDQDHHHFSKLDSTYPGLMIVDDVFASRKQLFEIKYDIL